MPPSSGDAWPFDLLVASMTWQVCAMCYATVDGWGLAEKRWSSANMNFDEKYVFFWPPRALPASCGLYQVLLTVRVCLHKQCACVRLLQRRWWCAWWFDAAQTDCSDLSCCCGPLLISDALVRPYCCLVSLQMLSLWYVQHTLQKH